MWCSGITSASHAEGPGFEPRRLQFCESLCLCKNSQKGAATRSAPVGGVSAGMLTRRRDLGQFCKSFLGKHFQILPKLRHFGRVVKAVACSAVGLCPRGFESHRCRAITLTTPVSICMVCTNICVRLLGMRVCRDPGSNRGPSDLQSDALPTELSRPRHGASGYLCNRGSDFNRGKDVPGRFLISRLDTRFHCLLVVNSMWPRNRVVVGWVPTVLAPLSPVV